MMFGCAKGNTIGEKADFSGYEGFQETEHLFVNSDVKDLVNRIENKETCVAFFGFANCPWCNEALPILNELSKANQQTILYVNTRPNSSVKSNTEIPDYDLLLEAIGSTFSLDDEGKHHLYVPFVVFVKNGEVVYYHEGTTADHDATERKMTQEEVEELRSTYAIGFDAIKE